MFLERLDHHLARIDEHVVVANQHMARGNELMEGIRSEREETRIFMRDLTRRSEVVLQQVVAAVAEVGAAVGQVGAELAEQRNQLRPNAQAVLRMIDRLGPQAG